MHQFYHSFTHRDGAGLTRPRRGRPRPEAAPPVTPSPISWPRPRRCRARISPGLCHLGLGVESDSFQVTTNRPGLVAGLAPTRTVTDSESPSQPGLAGSDSDYSVCCVPVIQLFVIGDLDLHDRLISLRSFQRTRNISSRRYHHDDIILQIWTFHKHQKRSDQSEQKMNNSPCSSHDRLSCARSRDQRHAITLEGNALVTSTPVKFRLPVEYKG
jgi:hypothetical protein